MAKDFRVGQVRTAQIIASGSVLNKPSLLIASASSPGVDFDGAGLTNAVLMANVGQDVFVFVSGTSGSQGTQTPGVTMFGGDIFVSGNIVTPDGVITASVPDAPPGGSTTQVQFNDAGSFGGDIGMTYAKGGWALTVGGSVLTPIVSPATGTLTLDSDSSMIIGGATVAITADGGAGAGSVVITTNDTTTGVIVGNVANVPVTLGHATSETTVGDNLTVTGNLTVNGTTTTVNSDNLVVKDPLVYIASGNASSNQNGGLAIASGSATADQALVFGRVANDTWGVGKLDVEAGAISGGDISAMTLVPIRASKFEIGNAGGSSTYITQSVAGHIELVAAKIELGIFNGASTVATTASNVRYGGLSLEYNWEIPGMPGTDSFYFVSGNVGGKDIESATIAVFGGDLVTSGNIHALNGITGSITKLADGSSYMIAGTNMTLTTGTNGDVTFDAAAGSSSPEFWSSATDANIYTTGSVAISGQSGITDAATAGQDTSFWISGSTSGIKGETGGVTTFGGDVHHSGSVYFGDPLGGSKYPLIKSTGAGKLRFQGAEIHASDEYGGFYQNIAVFSITGSQIKFSPLDSQSSYIDAAPMPGDNTYFFVSGNAGSNSDISVFGGDLVVSGNIVSELGLSGSLTRLPDGSSYLVAGANVTITSGTGGEVTIAASAGGGTTSTYWDSTSNFSIFTTGTVAISGESGVETATAGAGADTILWVSGNTGDSKDGENPGVTTFGGHVVMSGSVYGGVHPLAGFPLLNLRSDVIALTSAQFGEFGNDVNILIQGTTGSKDGAVRGVAEFTGDVHISGSRTGGSAYGGMYVHTTGSAQVLVGGTPEIVDWNAVNATIMSGSAFGVTPDVPSGNIGILQAGPWNVSFNASLSGAAHSTINLECRFGGEIQNQIAAQTVLNQHGSLTTVSAAGIIDVPQGGGFLELWVESDMTMVMFTRLSLFATSL